VLLQGKRAVIYGAGGAVGGAVARAFAREGARVFLAVERGPRSRLSPMTSWPRAAPRASRR